MRFDWYDYADEMAARETEGKRQISFEEWCARSTSERVTFDNTEDENDDICF